MEELNNKPIRLTKEASLGFIHLRVWSEDYEKRVGDGCAKKFYDWCIENYLPDGLEEFLGEK